MEERGILGDKDLDILFRKARTYYTWTDAPVPDEEFRAIYALACLGPTSANASPARFLWCRSDAARRRLADCASSANRPKILSAPVTVIVGFDLAFHEKLDRLFPHDPNVRSWFEGKPELIRETGLRNASLQGAYLITAARALGYDCGPMSGFDRSKVDAAFFAGTTIETNFLCSIGRGSDEKLFPRLPRLDFEEACQVL